MCELSCHLFSFDGSWYLVGMLNGKGPTILFAKWLLILSWHYVSYINGRMAIAIYLA